MGASTERSRDEFISSQPRLPAAWVSRMPRVLVVDDEESKRLELTSALRVAGFEATIVEMSWYGDHVVPLPLGEGFHARRLTIKSSQVGSVAPSQRARWDLRRRMQLALSLLQHDELDAGLLLQDIERGTAAAGFQYHIAQVPEHRCGDVAHRAVIVDKQDQRRDIAHRPVAPH